MHRNHVAAAWATIFGFLIFEELSHTVLFDFFEVFHHTHAVTCSVMLVKMIKSGARHVTAFRAGQELFAYFFGAITLDKSAVFVPDAAARTM